MPVRTRACATCRKKRIKCDGTLPHCFMCSRYGKLCPGPLQGPLIVDMTASAKNGSKRRFTPKQGQLDAFHVLQANHIGRGTIPEIAIEAFYASFLNHFTIEGEGKDIQNRLTWLQLLPVLTTDNSNHALILALEATAIAYGAIMTSQPGLSRHATERYGTALHAHHDILQRSGSKHDITIHAISTSVLLSFFEAMQATTANAYRAHIYGAARLLEVTGPGECGYGVLCQLFYHVRTQMLFVQLASDRNEVPIAARKILFDTLLYDQPPLIQRLMCCIAGLLDLQATMPRRENDGGNTHILLKLQIGQLWIEHYRQSAKNLSGYDAADKYCHFNDAFTALTLAYFSASTLLLAVDYPVTGDSGSRNYHARLILDVLQYIDTVSNPIAFMRMATPLLVVALYAEGPEHRASAIDIFEAWSRRSMRGISALALDALHRHAEKSMKVRG